jgi:hypothetical protein
VDNDIVKLIIVSDYYQTERYPGLRYFSPRRDEINTSIELVELVTWVHLLNMQAVLFTS